MHKHDLCTHLSFPRFTPFSPLHQFSFLVTLVFKDYCNQELTIILRTGRWWSDESTTEELQLVRFNWQSWWATVQGNWPWQLTGRTRFRRSWESRYSLNLKIFVFASFFHSWFLRSFFYCLDVHFMRQSIAHPSYHPGLVNSPLDVYFSELDLDLKQRGRTDRHSVVGLVEISMPVSLFISIISFLNITLFFFK